MELTLWPVDSLDCSIKATAKRTNPTLDCSSTSTWRWPIQHAPLWKGRPSGEVVWSDKNLLWGWLPIATISGGQLCFKMRNIWSSHIYNAVRRRVDSFSSTIYHQVALYVWLNSKAAERNLYAMFLRLRFMFRKMSTQRADTRTKNLANSHAHTRGHNQHGLGLWLILRLVRSMVVFVIARTLSRS